MKGKKEEEEEVGAARVKEIAKICKRRRDTVFERERQRNVNLGLLVRECVQLEMYFLSSV